MVKQPDLDPTPRSADAVGLPPRYFLYTLQQIQDMLSIHRQHIRRVIWFEGQDVGAVDPDKILARNIATPESEQPMWRIAEPELVRWMRHKGFRIYHRGWLRQ
jgi:hypothetical protein